MCYRRQRNWYGYYLLVLLEIWIENLSLAVIHATKRSVFKRKVNSSNNIDSVEITSVDDEGSGDDELFMVNSQSLPKMDRANILITNTNIHVNNEIEFISEENEDDCVDISIGLSLDYKILFLYLFSCPFERKENTTKDLR